MKKTLFLGVILVIVLSGCTGPQGPPPAPSDSNDGSNISEEELGEAWSEWERTPTGTLVYENNSENSTFRIELDRGQGTYDMELANTLNHTNNSFFNESEYTELTLNFSCAFIGQLTYNYSGLSNSSIWNSSNDSITPRGEIMRRIFTQYTPNEVIYELYNNDRTKKLGSCDIQDEDQLNLNIRSE